MTTPNLRARFETKPPTPKAGQIMSHFREEFADLAEIIDLRVPDSLEKSLALTKLEEAKYYTNQAIILADNQKEASA